MNGITKVKINRDDTDIRRIKFSVTGKNGTYALDTSNLPIKGTIVFASRRAAATSSAAGNHSAASGSSVRSQVHVVVMTSVPPSTARS